MTSKLKHQYPKIRLAIGITLICLAIAQFITIYYSIIKPDTINIIVTIGWAVIGVIYLFLYLFDKK